MTTRPRTPSVLEVLPHFWKSASRNGNSKKLRNRGSVCRVIVNKTDVAPETHRQIQELQSYQIELEPEGQGLQRSRHSDLNESAHVGHLALYRDGTIQEVNRIGTQLLGLQRSRQTGRSPALIATSESLLAFNAALVGAFEHCSDQGCAVVPQPEGVPPPRRTDEGAASPQWILRSVVRNTSAMSGSTCTDITSQVDMAPRLRSGLMEHAQLEQVLLNLFVNAAQAMPDGGHLHLCAENANLDGEQSVAPGGSRGCFVKLAITDTGSGIDAATQARIFEPFFVTRGCGKVAGSVLLRCTESVGICGDTTSKR